METMLGPLLYWLARDLQIGCCAHCARHQGKCGSSVSYSYIARARDPALCLLDLHPVWFCSTITLSTKIASNHVWCSVEMKTLNLSLLKYLQSPYKYYILNIINIYIVKIYNFSGPNGASGVEWRYFDETAFIQGNTLKVISKSFF